MNQRFVYRNPKITQHANGQACQNCGRQDGSVVAAHSNLQEHGRGSHHKAHDIFVAYLCHDCHSWLDTGGFKREPSGLYECNAADTFYKAQNAILCFVRGKSLTVIKRVSSEQYPLPKRRRV